VALPSLAVEELRRWRLAQAGELLRLGVRADDEWHVVTRLTALLSLTYTMSAFLTWRKGWDSNPRYPCRHAGFQDRCIKPLGHPSMR